MQVQEARGGAVGWAQATGDGILAAIKVLLTPAKSRHGLQKEVPTGDTVQLLYCIMALCVHIWAVPLGHMHPWGRSSLFS